MKPIMEEYPLILALEENNLFKAAKIEKSNTDPRLSTILTLVDKLGYRLDLVPKHQRRS